MDRQTVPQAEPANRTMASTLTASIRGDIIGGALAPGSKLAIRELCDRYSAGAIPMREALSRLATSGFVVAEDQRGFRVAAVSAEELIDITEARVHVECEVLRRSIETGDLDWEERLAGALHRLNRLPMLADHGGGIAADWERAHVALHAALIGGCRSKWLLSVAELLRDQTARYRHLSVAAAPVVSAAGRLDSPSRDVPAEHQQIVEAALARDAKRASLLLAEHFRITTRLVLDRGG